MPFGLPASDVGWSAGNTIGWSIQHPFQMNQPYHSFGTAPPGFKFILEANRASLVYAAWPCELSTISKALYSGPCNHSNSGMIFSWSCMKFGSLRKDFELWNCIPVSQIVLPIINFSILKRDTCSFEPAKVKQITSLWWSPLSTPFFFNGYSPSSTHPAFSPSLSCIVVSSCATKTNFLSPGFNCLQISVSTSPILYSTIQNQYSCMAGKKYFC